MKYLLILALLCVGCGGSGTPPDPTHGVVINEVVALGIDFVELYNPTSQPADLSGYIVADGQGRNEPRRMEAVTLEPGTILAPGEYLVVYANLGVDALPGLQTGCPVGGPPTCYYASWGIGTGGDTIFLDGPNEKPVSLLYPEDAVPEGQSWGRLPNGMGEFAPNQPTPGSDNRPPDPIPDSGMMDAGLMDAGLMDSGADTGTLDAGDDAAPTDTGIDAPVADAPVDAPLPDAPVTDAPVDAPLPDAPVTDA